MSSDQSNGDTHREGVSLFQMTGEKAFLAADAFYTTVFTSLNGSGVTGEAIVAYDVQTRTVTVAISASGLEANQPHIQHIHGFASGMNATTPTLAQDDDGDGYVELAEGGDTYGPIMLNLSANHANGAGSDNGHDHGDFTGFPTAPDGNIWFIEQYQLAADDPLTMGSFDLREIVIHGMTVPAGAGASTPGEVDGTAGYKVVLPVASGELTSVTSFDQFRSFIDATDFNYDAAAAGGGLHGHGMGGDMFFG
ncbi:MAG: hypothetical protein ABIQ32_09240 [Sphingomicrobium sp.]